MCRYYKRKTNYSNCITNSIYCAVNELSAESATIIISTLLVRLASTDACPITIPPTIPTVRPTLVGKRAPLLSVIQSLFLKSASINGGKGTLLRYD